MGGFKSPLLPLGVSVSPTLVRQGRGFGPLPFTIGISTAAPTEGRGFGPLPFTIGVSTTTPTEGRGFGPLPFTIGLVPGEPEIETPTREAKSSYAPLSIKPKFKEPKIDTYREQILREDDELLEVIMAFTLKD